MVLFATAASAQIFPFGTDRPDCKVITTGVAVNITSRKITWSGNCVNGFADGEGVITIATSSSVDADRLVEFRGRLVAGISQGVWIGKLLSSPARPEAFVSWKYTSVDGSTDGLYNYVTATGTTGSFWIRKSKRYETEAAYQAAIGAESPSAGSATAATANASAGTRLTAPTGVRRVTALLLPSTADGPQALSAYSRTGARCDFVWPFDGPVIESPYVDLLHVDSPKPGQFAFIWTGSCNSVGMLQGTGQILYIRMPFAGQRGFSTTGFIDQIEFDNGIQKGRIVGWLAKHANNIGLSGAAENFKFTGVVVANGVNRGIRENRRFVWLAGPTRPIWWEDYTYVYTCGADASDSQCIWASTNYNSAMSQYKSFQAQGQCREMARVSAEMKLKGGLNLSSYGEETCQADAQLAAVLSGRDPQAMYLAGARYENDNDRPRAKRIYLTLMEKFPKSSVSVNAADRLNRLSDVEAVESATSSAADRAANASENVRKQNYDQCMSNRDGCFSRCSNIRDVPSRNQCERSCPSCSR